jgi:HPt (histidine-containing phosphotransfer) domain-containing protein
LISCPPHSRWVSATWPSAIRRSRGTTTSSPLTLPQRRYERVLQLASERDQRELVHLFQLPARDPDGFQEFRGSIQGLIDSLVEGAQSRPQQQRCIHTLKGNAALMGIESIAELCHGIEDELAQTGEELGMGEMLAEREDVVEVSLAEHQQVLEMLAESARHQRVAAMKSRAPPVATWD